MGRSKIIFGEEVLMDLTADTVKEEKLLKGVTAHDAAGNPITGTCEFDANTQDATATAAEILTGKTAYNKGVKVTGEMPNNEAQEGKINTKDGVVNIKQGYHDGSGTVDIADTEKAKLIPANIRQDITILGFKGTMSSTEGANAQAKEVTPSMVEQVVLPDEGFNYLSQVIVKKIPYVESENSAGGTTVTIG